MQPSNFCIKFPCCSNFGKYEYETVAYNIMKILADSGDHWRVILWEEYLENIDLPPSKTIRDREYKIFSNVVNYFMNEKTVRNEIGGFWKYI